MSKIKTFSVQDSVFGRYIRFVVGDPDKAREHILKNYDITEESQSLDGIDENTLGCFDKLDRGPGVAPLMLIWLHDYNNTSADIAVLTHEILHLTFEAMRCVGVEYSEDHSEEVYAHYMDSILEQALNKLKHDKKA